MFRSFQKVALLFATVAVAGFMTAGAASAATTHQLAPQVSDTQGPSHGHHGGGGHINPGGPFRGFPGIFNFPPVSYYPVSTTSDQCGCDDTYVPPVVTYTAPTCGCSSTYTAPAPTTVTMTVTTNCNCSDTLALDTSGGLYFEEETGPKLAVGDWFTYDDSTYYVTYVDGNCFSAESASDVYPSESYGSGTVYEFGYDNGLSLENYNCLSTGDYSGFQYGTFFTNRYFGNDGRGFSFHGHGGSSHDGGGGHGGHGGHS